MDQLWNKLDIRAALEELLQERDIFAMDFLIENNDHIQERVFISTANLLNLEVDPDFDQEEALRRTGHPKAVGRSASSHNQVGGHPRRIPIGCWVWPGNTVDMEVIAQVKKDLIGWRLGWVITVVDRGFSSADNLRHLQRAGGHCMAGERMRANIFPIM